MGDCTIAAEPPSPGTPSGSTGPEPSVIANSGVERLLAHVQALVAAVQESAAEPKTEQPEMQFEKTAGAATSPAKLGLSLSGGGFRATLFHLGVIRLLRDSGMLSRVTHLVSVSGGSVLAAHLAHNWSRYTSTDDGEF